MPRCQRCRRAELRRFLAMLHARGLSGTQPRARAVRRGARFIVSRSIASPRSRTIPAPGCKAPQVVAAPAFGAVARRGGAPGRDRRRDDVLAVRDRALFELAYSSGLRVSELAGLDLTCARSGDRRSARAGARDAKERIVPVGAPARDALQRVARARRDIAGARTRRRCSSAASGRRLTPRAIQQRLAAWAVKRGLAAPCPPAHAAALVRLAPAAVLGRPARGAGAARSREHRQHADLHAPRFPVLWPRRTTRRIRARAEEAARRPVQPRHRVTCRAQKNGALAAPRKPLRRNLGPSSVRVLLHALAVETDIEAFALLFFGDAQADRPCR